MRKQNGHRHSNFSEVSIELLNFSNLVLVEEDGPNHCGVFRASHGVFFFSSSYSIFSTKTLYFIVSSSLWVAVLVSSSIDASHVDW